MTECRSKRARLMHEDEEDVIQLLDEKEALELVEFDPKDWISPVWPKLIFFQKRHLLSSSTAYAKYERFTKLCFHAMTLNNRPFAIIVFLNVGRKRVPGLLLGGA